MTESPPLVIVTGVSRGIGRDTARAFAERGYRLALLGRASAASEATRAECQSQGAREACLIEVDFTDLAAVERGAEQVLTRFGTPSIVVHNAGNVERRLVEAMSIAEWQRQIDVNLSAPFVLTRALLPAMRARRAGRILFIGSISSTLGTARHSAYCASKWGIVGFMKSLAAELSDSGLMTAALLPGSVDTDMLAGSGFAPRMTSEDVTRSLLYLALDAPLAHNGAVVEMFGV